MAAVSETASRPRRTWRQRLVIVAGVLVVLGSAGGALGAAYGAWKFGQVETYALDLPEAASGAPENFLVVGSDSRDAVSADDPNAGAFLRGPTGGQRSDTILVVRVDPSKETATMLSLPRDLWVPIAGRDERQRINAAYGMGKQVLADTIQAYLGIPVNHYVEIDFRGFQGLVSAIDGVPMYFERAMRDANSGLDVLHPGCVRLDGPQALAFARSRHLEYILRGVWRSDPTGDLGHITRQQIFVRRAISRAVSRGLTNPLTLKELVDVGVENIGIDKRLSARDLLSLGRRFERFSGDQLVTHTLPVSPYRTDGGADVLQLDEAASVSTLDLFRDEPGAVPTGGETIVPPTAGQVAVRVLNGSGIDRHATNVAGALQAAGFTIAGTGNVADIGGAKIDRTEIHHAPADLAAADLLGRHLTAGAEVVADPDVKPGTLVLVTGRDFTTVEGTARAAAPSPAASTTTRLAAAPTTQPDTAVGRTPGDVPPGVDCG